MANADLVNLPVELLHRIFDHFDGRFLFQSIRLVCKKLDSAVITYNRYKFNSPAIKITDLMLISEVIQLENIVSLSLKNDNASKLIVDVRLQDEKLFQCRRLRSLALNEFHPSHLTEILLNFLDCPLESLSIAPCKYKLMPNSKLEAIIPIVCQFKIRKVCFAGVDRIVDYMSWLASCPIEDLTIEQCCYNTYEQIFRDFPYLRSLTLRDWEKNNHLASSTQSKFE